MKFFTLSSKWQIDIMNFYLLQLKHKREKTFPFHYTIDLITENKILYYIWLCILFSGFGGSSDC